MPQKILIDPVTRIEGHSEIDLTLGADGQVEEVKFSVKTFRGFEKFLEGTPIETLPQLTARICGICHTAHILASCKAIEDALGITLSPEAYKLREFLHLGNFIESHALSVGVLSLPDLIAADAGPSGRNIAFLLNSREELVRRVMKLRQLGTLITRLAGKRPVHAITPVIGGCLQSLNPEERDEIARAFDGAKETVQELWRLITESFRANADLRSLGQCETAFLALHGTGQVELYDGDLAVVNSRGQVLHDLPPSHYMDFVEEEERDFSYMKFPRLKDGTRFRVGPLARVNVGRRFDTPLAQGLLGALVAEYGAPLQNSMLYHLARVVELMHCVEKAERLAQDDALLSPHVKPGVYKARAGRGIGVLEAPRGTLVHIYDIDADGFVHKLRFFVATQHNNFAINDALAATARRTITGPTVAEPLLNQLEMIVRAYDPCLSCATHAVGTRELVINVYQHNGQLIGRWA